MWGSLDIKYKKKCRVKNNNNLELCFSEKWMT